MSVLQFGHRAKTCHLQAYRDFHVMSALPPKADIARRGWDVCFVPVYRACVFRAGWSKVSR
jgi:hypothetical protein